MKDTFFKINVRNTDEQLFFSCADKINAIYEKSGVKTFIHMRKLSLPSIVSYTDDCGEIKDRDKTFAEVFGNTAKEITIAFPELPTDLIRVKFKRGHKVKEQLISLSEKILPHHVHCVCKRQMLEVGKTYDEYDIEKNDIIDYTNELTVNRTFVAINPINMRHSRSGGNLVRRNSQSWHSHPAPQSPQRERLPYLNELSKKAKSQTSLTNNIPSKKGELIKIIGISALCSVVTTLVVLAAVNYDIHLNLTK